jgi:hypothetical protein
VSFGDRLALLVAVKRRTSAFSLNSCRFLESSGNPEDPSQLSKKKHGLLLSARVQEKRLFEGPQLSHHVALILDIQKAQARGAV